MAETEPLDTQTLKRDAQAQRAIYEFQFSSEHNQKSLAVCPKQINLCSAVLFL